MPYIKMTRADFEAAHREIDSCMKCGKATTRIVKTASGVRIDYCPKCYNAAVDRLNKAVQECG